MSLFIASLNSGSNGNCYYIGNQHEAVLIDAGISCRETERRMKRLGLNIQKVKAIFVSHEHSDHITGIPVLSRKYQLPVYITQATLDRSGIAIESHLNISFKPDEPVPIGSLEVTAFAKRHDAVHPHSFIISGNALTVGVFTDIGGACDNVISHFSRCHAAFLEANYDDEMLDTGNYPWHLKRRIRGGEGHLSNKQAAELFLNHRPPYMSHVVLSHLSKNNNDPALVQQLFEPLAGETIVCVASRHEESPVFHITGNTSVKTQAGMLSGQASLF